MIEAITHAVKSSRGRSLATDTEGWELVFGGLVSSSPFFAIKTLRLSSQWAAEKDAANIRMETASM
jgi:hypothetical protein